MKKDNDIVSTDETFDIKETKNEIVEKYTGSVEVDNLTKEIEVYNTSSIVKFGSDIANEISKASDTVLKSMSTNQLNDTGKMFDALNEIMKQFDIDEIREEPKGIKKIFCNIRF